MPASSARRRSRWADRSRGRRCESANGPACTPGSVRGPEPRGRSSLSATRCRAAPAAYPGTRRAASSSPVWPCSGRGLPCEQRHRCSGGLLHHPFTLTGVSPGGLLSVALSRGSLRVGVTHRPALRSPDVPRCPTASRCATRPSSRPIRITTLCRFFTITARFQTFGGIVTNGMRLGTRSTGERNEAFGEAILPCAKQFSLQRLQQH